MSRPHGDEVPLTPGSAAPPTRDHRGEATFARWGRALKSAVNEAGWSLFAGAGGAPPRRRALVAARAAVRTFRERARDRGERTFADAAAEVLGPRSVTVLDVGARWGTGDAWYLVPPLARVIGFEPDAEECRRLNAAAPDWKTFEPIALGAYDGPATIFVTTEPGCSSLYRPDPRAVDRFPLLRGALEITGTYPVQLRRLDHWASGAGVGPIAFIKLDVQGAERDILEGAGSLLDDCLGLEIEVEFSPLYEGQPLFADVDALARARGFELWRLQHLVHYSEGPEGIENRLRGRTATVYNNVAAFAASGAGRLTWATAIYFRHHATLPSDARGLEKRIVLASLLEAAGDLDGARACLQGALHVHAGHMSPGHRTLVGEAIPRLEKLQRG